MYSFFVPQVYIWAIGRELGVVALDTQRRGEVYFLTLPSFLQTSVCVEAQGLNAVELDLYLSEMLTAVKYFETYQAEEGMEKEGTEIKKVCSIITFAYVIYM